MNSQSNEPIYKRELTEIGSKGEEAMETPIFDEAQEDPEIANLVSEDVIWPDL